MSALSVQSAVKPFAISHASEASRDGMKQGWAGTLEQLAEYLAKA